MDTPSMPDRAAELHAQLTRNLAELVTGEDWRRALEVASRFHSYSFGNCMLIAMQRPHASRVAGFQTWKSLSRHVRKGEHGIAILAPLTYRRKVESEDAGSDDYVVGVRGFRVVHVFDIAQTDGVDIPDVRPSVLQGESVDGLYGRLADQVAAAGFEVRREAPSIPGANGETRHASRVVVVRPDVDPAQATKTLAHELAHVLMHCTDAASNPADSRSLREVEAESVAYIVCQASGLVTEAYSLPYVAGWAEGDLRKVGATAERVLATARRILAA